MFRTLHAQGIRLFTIRDNEWLNDKDRWKRIIRNQLVTVETLRASKLELRKIGVERAFDFYAKNHAQGGIRAGSTLALVHEGKIYAAMTFDRIRSHRGKASNSKELELTRFCVRNGFQIHGSASRLFKNLLKVHKPDTVVSYSHNRWFNGKVYPALGFKLDGQVAPDYQTLWSGQHGVKGLRSKQFSRKSRLQALGEKLKGRTEAKILDDLGVHRIYDYGKQRWLYTSAVSDPAYVSAISDEIKVL
jgi:DNA-directed RNA polymerase subunit N (RpoN/RPB10)